jgi:hypothetical protein
MYSLLTLVFALLLSPALRLVQTRSRRLDEQHSHQPVEDSHAPLLRSPVSEYFRLRREFVPCSAETTRGRVGRHRHSTDEETTRAPTRRGDDTQYQSHIVEG